MFAALRHSLHLVHVGFVLMREGVFALIPKRQVPAILHPLLWILAAMARRDAGDRGTRIVAALTRLGPSYVKLGQFLATRPDLVGLSLARDLEALQDRMPAFDQAEAERRVAAALGKPLNVLFVEFGPAVAAASIAQVHRAVVDLDGVLKPVAVKVRRPGIERVFNRDIAAQKFVAGLVRRFVPASRRLKPVEVIETLERTVLLEMDLRFEAAALSEMGENIAKDPDFRVPQVDWERTARDCLTMEWIDGIKLNDLAAIDAAGIDRVDLARIALQSFLRHALRDGFSMPTCIRATCSCCPRGISWRWISALWAGWARMSGASSRKFCSALSIAIIDGLPRCISRRVMCRNGIRWRISPRPCARSARRSMAAMPLKFPWPSFWVCCSNYRPL